MASDRSGLIHGRAGSLVSWRRTADEGTPAVSSYLGIGPGVRAKAAGGGDETICGRYTPRKPAREVVGAPEVPARLNIAPTKKGKKGKEKSTVLSSARL